MVTSTRPHPGHVLAAVAVAWFAAAWLAGATGLLQAAPGELPLALAGFAGLPVLAAALLIGFSARFRAWAAALDVGLLTRLHAWRFAGFAFIVAASAGLLPWGFALPAGLGDILIALAAPFVAARLVRAPREGARLFLVWSVLGLADLVLAVTLGVLLSGLIPALTAGGPTTALMSEPPLSLIPTFGVPLMIVLHLLALANLRTLRATPAPTPSSVPA